MCPPKVYLAKQIKTEPGTWVFESCWSSNHLWLVNRWLWFQLLLWFQILQLYHRGIKHLHGTHDTLNCPINVTASNILSLHDQFVKIDVCVNEDGPANIISKPKLVQSGLYPIAFDTDAGNAFNIYSKTTGKLVNHFTHDHHGVHQTYPISTPASNND